MNRVAGGLTTSGFPTLEEQVLTAEACSHYSYGQDLKLTADGRGGLFSGGSDSRGQMLLAQNLVPASLRAFYPLSLRVGVAALLPQW